MWSISQDLPEIVVSVTAVRIGAVDAAQSAAPVASQAAVGGSDFASVLADIASSSVKSVESGEAAALAGIQGKASVQQVVEAVMNAEQNLQAAIAIRDKVVGAYQEITRMAI